MAKKIPDEICLQNMERLRELFDGAVPSPERYAIVYGCGVDVGLMNFVVVRRTTYTYASYIIGYDASTLELVVVPVDVGMQETGEPVFLVRDEIDGAKISWLSKEITIKSRKFPKRYIQFSVPAGINEDPDGVCIPCLQQEQAKDFHSFFKGSYAK